MRQKPQRVSVVCFGLDRMSEPMWSRETATKQNEEHRHHGSMASTGKSRLSRIAPIGGQLGFARKKRPFAFTKSHPQEMSDIGMFDAAAAAGQPSTKCIAAKLPRKRFIQLQTS